MSCAACSARVEKAVNKVEGVTSCSVSLLTNSMGVEGTADPAVIIKAVTDAGYGAALRAGSSASGSRNGSGPEGADPLSGSQGTDGREAAALFAEQEEALKDRETPVLKKRLISSVIFLLILMYVSMGHGMWGWPLPAFFSENAAARGLLQMLLAIIVMIINQRFFINGYRTLFHRAPNMDTLVALGSSASFGWSVYALFMITHAQLIGDEHMLMHYSMDLYFESAAMIVTLITIGKMLEAMSKGKTTDALKSLLRLTPKEATLLRDGKEVVVPASHVRAGDIFLVHPGESIPADGIVTDGQSAVDESALTGESIPVDKEIGDPVSQATINRSGVLTCEATRVGTDTTLSQIIKMVSDAAATKAPIARIADKVSSIFVPAVILIAVATIVIWLLVGQDFSYALARGISVLVISCPCALGLATPVAIMVGNGLGAKNGILFKNAASIEETGRTQIVALDKTGTITGGEPHVTDLIPAENSSAETLLSLAYLLEKKSEHPLAGAIVRYMEETLSDTDSKNLSQSTLREFTADRDTTDFSILPGNGLTAVLTMHGQKAGKLTGGSLTFVESLLTVPEKIRDQAFLLSEGGKTPLLFALDDQCLGMIAVADTIRADSREAILELKAMGIRTVMLTGDNARTAAAIAKEAGVDHVIAGVMPDEKESFIRKLKEIGKTAMVGDGINDAPALTRADTGIAIGAGTDVAIDAASVVLMNSRLSDVAAAIRLSRATLRNIHQNLFWAFFYNVIGIPLAAGAYIHFFGLTLNPMFGAAAMSLSSFCVVSNALRLNLFSVHSTKKDRPIKHPVSPVEIIKVTANQVDGSDQIPQTSQTKQEEETMTKTMTIEGMMCPHCEAAVKKALEALDGVEAAEVSHEKGTAVVTLSADLADDLLKEAVEAKDYAVKGIA